MTFCSPFDLACDIFDRAIFSPQFVAKFDYRESYHVWVAAKGVSDLILYCCGGVESHNKVVASMIEILMFLCGSGEEEVAPVCDATNDSFGL